MNILGIDFEDWFHPQLIKKNIEDKKYYAIKVQHSDDFKSGLDEARFMKRLPKKVDV